MESQPLTECPTCHSRALDEAIREPDRTVFRCLFCWRLIPVELQLGNHPIAAGSDR